MNQNEIIEHFLKWSGGYFPNEMDDSQLRTYIGNVLPLKFEDEMKVLKFLREYKK